MWLLERPGRLPFAHPNVPGGERTCYPPSVVSDECAKGHHGVGEGSPDDSGQRTQKKRGKESPGLAQYLPACFRISQKNTVDEGNGIDFTNWTSRMYARLST